MEWVIPGLLPARGIALMAAAGGIGKSTLAVQLCALLAAGNYITIACSALGLNPTTVHRWIARGLRAAPGDELFADFAADVAKARALAEIGRAHV